jgi:AraC-like DNA-binding protein
MGRVRSPTDFRKSLPEIHSIGMSVWDPIHTFHEHVGPCWEVVHIIRGQVNLHLAGRIFRGRQGDTLLVPARAPHRDEFPPGTEFEVLHVMFYWRAAPAWLPDGINADLVRLPPADKQAIRELAFDTFDCFRRQRPRWPDMTRLGLCRLLLFLRSATEDLRLPRPAGETASARERRREMIQRAKAFIRDNLGRPIALADIAAHLGISACHLSHLFSQESGFTLSAYLGAERMEAAARLLADPRRRIAETAYAVGYEDPHYFGRAFRRHFGCTPGMYRAKLLRARRIVPSRSAKKAP